jgi:hypothetical protein
VKQGKNPLGYVDLPDGSKPIFPMNDIFLNYTFETEEHWEILRSIINILLEAYIKLNPDTKIKLIEGNIKVRTQFRHFLDTQHGVRDQDLKLTENESKETYIEFQNRAKTKVPVEIRSVEYFGLGISRNKGELSNQIWLLAQDVPVLLDSNKFARFVLKNELTGKDHLNNSGIMYVSLKKLSKEESAAGELAKFLLGKLKEPKNDLVKKIAETLNSSFSAFKVDKEAVSMLSLRERAWEERDIKLARRALAKGYTFEQIHDLFDLDIEFIKQIHEDDDEDYEDD